MHKSILHIIILNNKINPIKFKDNLILSYAVRAFLFKLQHRQMHLIYLNSYGRWWKEEITYKVLIYSRL